MYIYLVNFQIYSLGNLTNFAHFLPYFTSAHRTTNTHTHTHTHTHTCTEI